MRAAAITMDEKKYRRLVARATPCIPENEAEYQTLLGQIEKLMEKEESVLSLEETRLLSLLATLAEQYENKANFLSQASPHEVLAHLMESRGLRHRDIWELFGSRRVASEVINGKRPISKAQAKKLAAFFRVDAGLFI